MTVREAARLAGVDSDTIRRWCDRGQVISMRTPGGHRRVDNESLSSALLPASKPNTAPRRTVQEALEAMLVEVDGWWDWVPPQHLTEDQLAHLRLTISGAGGLLSSLNQVAAAITDRLAELDAQSS